MLCIVGALVGGCTGDPHAAPSGHSVSATPSQPSLDSGIRGRLYTATTTGPIPNPLPSGPSWSPAPPLGWVARPLPPAGTISLLSDKGDLLRKVRATRNGRFELPAPPGTYIVSAVSAAEPPTGAG